MSQLSKCQCLLTSTAPLVGKIITNLIADNPPIPLKRKLSELQIAVNELEKCAALHREFEMDYARAMCEQSKRMAIDPPVQKLQTTSYKTGRDLTRQIETDDRKRKAAIEKGRMRRKAQ
jgi:hypothetical protein